MIAESKGALRTAMVRSQLVDRGITDERLLTAMGRVPRHRFMPRHRRFAAYADRPVSIGQGQTISQPYMVAAMIQAMAVGPGARVLDVGTGSGYQAAVLAELGCEVYSVEILPTLAGRARAVLDRCGYERVHTRVADGRTGWPEQAPFDAIVAATAPESTPQPLRAQLVVGGRLVLPIGDRWRQVLHTITRTAAQRWQETPLMPVQFVPMTGTNTPH